MIIRQDELEAGPEREEKQESFTQWTILTDLKPAFVYQFYYCRTVPVFHFVSLYRTLSASQTMLNLKSTYPKHFFVGFIIFVIL